MVKRIYARQPAFLADAPSHPKRAVKSPATDNANLKPVEPGHTTRPVVTLRGSIPRLLRIKQIIAPGGPIPVSKNTWLGWVDSRYAPASHSLSTRIRVWLESDITAFVVDKLAKDIQTMDPRTEVLLGDNVAEGSDTTG